MNEYESHRDEHDCSGDAAAYVLGALEGHELAPFLHHLDSCAICRDEVSSLQVVADMLPAAVSPVAAPRGLRRRVLATIYEEAELFHAAGTRREPVPAHGRAWRPVPRAFQALAVVSLVAVGIAVGALALGGPAGSGSGNRVVLASTTLPTIAKLRLAPGRTQLAISRLPAAPQGRVYEVWLQRRGQTRPTDALFTPTSDGHATVAVPGDLRDVDRVMVTDEPAGGSIQPTSTPVISASLQ